VKLLTEFDGNPKVIEIGLAGAGLYCRSLAFSGKYETDGFISSGWVNNLVVAEGVPELPKQMLSSGLWKPAESDKKGFVIPDYLAVNRSHEDMDSLREKRSAAGKKGGKAKTKQSAGKFPSTSYSSSTSSSSSSFSLSTALASEFSEWLEHYHRVTGRTAVRGSDTAQRAFKARRKDWSLDELKQATVGCHSDTWRVEHSHDVPDTILRAKNVEPYIAAASNPKPKDKSTATQDRLLELQRKLESEGK